MRSRWFHRPALHTPIEGHERKVSWLELFYDLVFVASIIQFGDFLSHEKSIGGFMLFAGHFTPLWVAWSGFTFYANRFDVDDFLHRVLVLAQMFAVGIMAVASHHAMQGDHVTFSLAYAGAQALIAVLHVRSAIQDPQSAAYSRFWGGAFAFGSLAFVASAFLPNPWCYLLWPVGIGAILLAPLSRRSRELFEQFPLDQEHLTERYGLLTIIVLGESFVKVLTYLTGNPHGSEMEYLLKGLFNLTLTCSIWWIYFDDIAGSQVRKGAGSWIAWLLGHLPLTLAITAVGVAVKLAIKFDMALPAPDAARWMLAGSLALTLFSVAAIDAVTERRNAELSDRARVTVRLASAGIMLLLGQVGGSMNAGVFLGLTAALCVGQVLFDMMMAPLEETHHTAAAVPLHKLDAQHHERDDHERPPDIRSAVRRGAPSSLRGDLYFFFIDGSWARVFVAFGFAYIFLNVVFAALYQLDAASIEGAATSSFADAFFFSVQTLSSLGYGALTPATPWANLLVTIEAAVGMLFVAVATGLIFAKASRPAASVMFSNAIVLTQRHGKRTLMLRLANARGNEVVDATVTVSVVVDETTPEGHHLRRVHELPLERNRNPLFVLTWLVMHTIDDDSPLAVHGLDNVRALVVSLVGHDATYGQTTHARHVYVPADVHEGRRFVDVIHQLPDGRLMVDLTTFHDTISDADTEV